MNISDTTKIQVNELMKDKKQVLLIHAGKTYSLSITKRGKLILTLAEACLQE